MLWSFCSSYLCKANLWWQLWCEEASWQRSVTMWYPLKLRCPAKFSNHTRHSPMHSITDQHSTLKIHPRFPYPCFAAFLQLGFASVLLGCLHLMQHLWISRVSWQTFWPSSCASVLMTRIIFHLHGCTRRSVEVIAAAALFMQLLSIDSCL